MSEYQRLQAAILQAELIASEIHDAARHRMEGMHIGDAERLATARVSRLESIQMRLTELREEVGEIQ
jgi:hypothetical protein